MMENATLVLDLLQDVPFLDQKQGFLQRGNKNIKSESVKQNPLSLNQVGKKPRTLLLYRVCVLIRSLITCMH